MKGLNMKKEMNLNTIEINNLISIVAIDFSMYFLGYQQHIYSLQICHMKWCQKMLTSHQNFEQKRLLTTI